MRCNQLISLNKIGLKEPVYRALFLTALLALQTSCSGNSAQPSPSPAQSSPEVTGSEVTGPAVAGPEVAAIPAGQFIVGSDAAEREYAYQIDEVAYGHSRTRTGGWYDSERARSTDSTDAYDITITPITNAQYAEFIKATNHPAPDVDQSTWEGYGLIHPFSRTRKYVWQNNSPPAGREQHPVVMVSYDDVNAYAQWLSDTTNESWRLPTLTEWEKAVRGTEGNYFPWGNDFDRDKLNSHDAGPFDTTAVGTQSSTGPFGLVDGAGQVFEWIDTPEAQRAWVKGGSWDDSGCGVCRPAARHSRPKNIKHILIGFRLVKIK